MFWKLTTCIIICLIWGSAFHCLLIFGCTHEVSFKITHWSFKVLITNTCPKRKNNQSWSCISKNLKLMQTARFFFLTKLKLDQVPRSAFQVWPINPNQHDKKVTSKQGTDLVLLFIIFRWGTKVYVQNRLEPSSGILHHYHLTRGSTLTRQDYNPSSVVYIPEPIRAIWRYLPST